MNFNEIIGDNIRVKRKEKNLTIEELSEILEISPSFLGLIERGERCTSIYNLCKIKDFFGITLDELVSKKTPKLNKGDILSAREENLDEKKSIILNYLDLMCENELNYFAETIKNFIFFVKGI